MVADEPTGNLDRATGARVMDTLERLNERGTTLIVVTDDPDVAARAHRRLHVLDGHVTETAQPASPTPSADTAVLATKPPAPEGRPSRLRLPDGLIGGFLRWSQHLVVLGG
ncbi:hypothetical protein [Actinomyces radicidentis]|uniref:hypothetical protein n=1 Tax=Actinomyces radicidentis TaxID=111015 RepID=UPI0026E093E9|nr:hypothetical protein [Actinomyces radicidentis]